MKGQIDPRLSEAFAKANGFPLERHLLVLGLMGSHSHGTYVPPTDPDAIDDVDFMGIVIPPEHRLLGLHGWEHWVWQEEELDVVLYSAHKAFTLMLKGNPNILGLLWLSSYTAESIGWGAVLAKRERFSSLAAYHAFAGYAHGQLKRMTAFDVERMREYEALTQEIEAAGVAVGDVLRGDANKLAHLAYHAHLNVNSLQAFRRLHRQFFSGYMGAKRKALVERHGYDAKNAGHLIRLLRMAVEFLETGRLNVDRTGRDADELREIKAGSWSLDRVQATAESLFEKAKAAKDRSDLPEHPDGAAVDSLLIWLHRQVLK